MNENCVKDGSVCLFYCPYDEASYNACLYGASVEDYEVIPPCIVNTRN